MTNASRRRRRFLTPGRVIIALVVIGGPAFAIATMLGTVSGPTVQLPLSMEGMPPHLLNVWTEPDPLRVGEAELTAQVVDVGGNPRSASAIAFRVLRSEGEPGSSTVGNPLPTTYIADVGRYRAMVSFPEAGAWLVEVDVRMQGRTASVRFPVEVGP